MTHYGPKQEWLQAQAAAVVAKYKPDPRCTEPAWPCGPQCEEYGPHTTHIAPSHFLQGEYLFDGDVPSNTTKGATYHVKVYRFGNRAECTCKGFHYNHTCSHIKQIREVLKQP